MGLCFLMLAKDKTSIWVILDGHLTKLMKRFSTASRLRRLFVHYFDEGSIHTYIDIYILNRSQVLQLFGPTCFQLVFFMPRFFLGDAKVGGHILWPLMILSPQNRILLCQKHLPSFELLVEFLKLRQILGILIWELRGFAGFFDETNSRIRTAWSFGSPMIGFEVVSCLKWVPNQESFQKDN